MGAQVHPPGGLLRFGAFEVDPEARELRKQGLHIRLPDQCFQILLVLLENPGRVVPREELHKRLWPEDTFVEFDHNLNNAISRLREALGDSATSPRFIETLPRRGYRFLADVYREGEQPATQDAASSETVPAAARSGRRWAIALGAAVLLLAVAGYFALRTPTAEIDSLAVLPFTDARLGSGGEEDYFAYAMTDALTTELSKIGALRVTSLTSAMHFKELKKPLPEIARALGVDAVVEGTVARDGNQVRITVQLIEAAADKHLWAESYERELQNILALQGEVAQAIARQVRAKLTPQQEAVFAAARPTNPQALEAYLKGEFYISKWDESVRRRGADYLEEAIRLDPSFAPAYAALGNYYRFQDLLPPSEALPLAKENAMKALALDETLADAHYTLATILREDWDWVGSEREFRRTLELEPSHGRARQQFAFLLGALGRHEEALPLVQRMMESDPLNEGAYVYAGRVYFFARQFDRAIEEVRAGLAFDENNPWLLSDLALYYDAAGKHEEAIAWYERTIKVIERDPLVLCQLVHALAKAGRTDEARRLRKQVDTLARREYVAHTHRAFMYLGLGETDRVFEMLEEAYRQRDAYLVWINSPVADPIRDDPRLQSLLRRMNFPP